MDRDSEEKLEARDYREVQDLRESVGIFLRKSQEDIMLRELLTAMATALTTVEARGVVPAADPGPSGRADQSWRSRCREMGSGTLQRT